MLFPSAVRHLITAGRTSAAPHLSPYPQPTGRRAPQGKWKGVTVIASVITIGIIVVWLGVNLQIFWLVLLGRVVYGLGACECAHDVTAAPATVPCTRPASTCWPN